MTLPTKDDSNVYHPTNVVILDGHELPRYATINALVCVIWKSQIVYQLVLICITLSDDVQRGVHHVIQWQSVKRPEYVSICHFLIDQSLGDVRFMLNCSGIFARGPWQWASGHSKVKTVCESIYQVVNEVSVRVLPEEVMQAVWPNLSEQCVNEA